MSAHWITHVKERSLFASSLLSTCFAWLGRPAVFHYLRLAIVVLLVLWAAALTARVVWLFVPVEPAAGLPEGELLNPIVASGGRRDREPVDVETLAERSLFGTAADGAAIGDVAEAEPESASPGGIEEGARETELDLVLRGSVAAPDEGGGFAVIEHGSRQQVYGVGDTLPGTGKVTLAKVLRDRVVLNNNGTYELLLLFEDAAEIALLPATRKGQRAAGGNAGDAQESGRVTMDRTGDREVTRLAASFRDRLYDDPRSLAQVVQVAPVRRDGDLMGYRVRPGSAPEVFSRLGLRAGDLVTAVNGVALDDPSNTLQLYQTMRTASSVTVELERDGQPMSIAVSLD